MPQGKGSLQDRMNRALEAWANNPLASYEEIARIAGISDKTFWRYRQNPEFMDRYHKICQARFNSMEGQAIEKLKECLDAGLWNAVKYVLDSQGYKPTEKKDVSLNGGLDISVDIDE